MAALTELLKPSAFTWELYELWLYYSCSAFFVLFWISCNVLVFILYENNTLISNCKNEYQSTERGGRDEYSETFNWKKKKSMFSLSVCTFVVTCPNGVVEVLILFTSLQLFFLFTSYMICGESVRIFCHFFPLLTRCVLDTAVYMVQNCTWDLIISYPLSTFYVYCKPVCLT